LLGAYRNRVNVEGAERVFKSILSLGETVSEKYLASAFVLMANTYSAAGETKLSEETWKEMKRLGLRKKPGQCWVEIDGKLHTIYVDDYSHPEHNIILALWNSLQTKLLDSGHQPHLPSSLRPGASEQEQVEALCGHSEKLAIAFADLKTPVGEPLRIVKNLRVCQDCHEATKKLTLLLNREIHCRDANIHHHYKAGQCSCGDFF